MNKRTIDIAVRSFLAFFLILSIVLLVKTIVNHAEAKKEETVYVVCTDEESHPYAVITDVRIMEPVKPAIDLTASQREQIAKIVAGQAGGKSVTCQTMVANVIYNQLMQHNKSIGAILSKYGMTASGKPTDETYDAVDAIFARGEWLLDDTVLWMAASDNVDEWHNSLVFITDCDGINFYEVAWNG